MIELIEEKHSKEIKNEKGEYEMNLKKNEQKK